MAAGLPAASACDLFADGAQCPEMNGSTAAYDCSTVTPSPKP